MCYMTFRLLSILSAVGLVMTTSSCVVPAGYPGEYGVSTVSTYSTSAGLKILPHGHRTVYIGSIPYFFYNNYWYTKRSGRYYRTATPKGYANYFKNTRSNYNYSRNSYNSHNRYNKRRVYGGNNQNIRRNNSSNRTRQSRNRQANHAELINATRNDLQNRNSNSQRSYDRSSSSYKSRNFRNSNNNSYSRYKGRKSRGNSGSSYKYRRRSY